jgi:hypothetical protein
MSLSSSLSVAWMAARFTIGLPRYLATPLTPQTCHARVTTGLGARADNLVRMLERAVYPVEGSPYRALLRHAGIGRDDVRALVAKEGVEGALDALYDAGVYLRLDEFKGRRLVRRGSLTIDVAAHQLDNPLAERHLALQSGGSRSGGTRIYLDLAHYGQEAGYDRLFVEAHGLLDRPQAIWRPTPPWSAGIGSVLKEAKIGRRTERWFSQRPFSLRARGVAHNLLTRYAVLTSRLVGTPLPTPEHVPLDEAWRVAEWLGARTAEGRPALLNTNAASGVRVCIAALERGIAIDGTLFRFGGEPLTAGKARVVADAGASVVCHYTMSEVGRIGIACACPEAVDDVHLLTDKLAIIQRSRERGLGRSVAVNVLTTLLPTTPKLMLNVETDDYGVVGRRACGCPIGAAGFDRHLHSIRSVDKLTSEGMTFVGDDLIRLLEEVLPQRFGGHATDYQFLEQEEGGLPRVSLLVSPRIGPLDAAAVADCVHHFLDNIPRASDDYGQRWREAGTLRVVRREPVATGASKILSLHVDRPPAAVSRPATGP